MIAWFNLYPYWGRRDNDFLEYCARMKGKNVRFIDSTTGLEMTDEEIEALEYSSPSFNIIEDQETNTLYPKTYKKIKTKETVKPRGRPKKDYSKLRQFIINKANGQCRRCGKENADQMHHIDGNPYNNYPTNLQLLCYDCHKIADKEVRQIKKAKRI